MNTMKAVVYNKHAKPDKLEYRDVEKPVPGDNEVLIKILAASVNAADYRSKQLRIIPKRKIFGIDIAGKVESTGKNVARFQQGDEVIGELFAYGSGGFAEYAVATENALVKKPVNLLFEDAAALPLAAETALQALRNKVDLKKGQHVLIVGSAGGVGTYAVQLAKYFGAVVTGVCSGANVEQTRSLGADYVIDYTLDDFTKTNIRYDLILAINGNTPLTSYKRILKPGGIILMVGGTYSQIFKFLILGRLMSFGSKKLLSLSAKSNQEDLAYIVKLAEDCRIRAVIDRRYTLDKTAEAMKYAAAGHARGKVVITM